MGSNGFPPSSSSFAARMRDRKMPRPFTPAGGILFQHLVRADVHETQAAPGLDVLVAISADVEGRAAVEMAVTMVVMPMTVMPTMAMAMMSAVAMTAMPMTTPMTTMTTRRGRGHRGSTEGDSGDDGE
jgi:hypothetical protein